MYAIRLHAIMHGVPRCSWHMWRITVECGDTARIQSTNGAVRDDSASEIMRRNYVSVNTSLL